MRLMQHLLLVIVFFITTPAAADFGHVPEYSRLYDPKRDPFVDGREAIANAQATQRRILIELGGDWCAWCNKLERFIAGNKTVKTKLYKNFVVLKVNVSDENDNREFLSAFPKVIGYPHFYVAESDGSVLYSKDTAELLENGKYSEQRFLVFIERWRQKSKNDKQTALNAHE